MGDGSGWERQLQNGGSGILYQSRQLFCETPSPFAPLHWQPGLNCCLSGDILPFATMPEALHFPSPLPYQNQSDNGDVMHSPFCSKFRTTPITIQQLQSLLPQPYTLQQFVMDFIRDLSDVDNLSGKLIICFDPSNGWKSRGMSPT